MNPKTDETHGFSLEAEQLHDLTDVYHHVQTAKNIPCQYVMVSMWRCVDSPFEILGPITGSPAGLTAPGIYKFVWRCIEEFQYVGFETDITVCDGATPNLKLVRMNCDIASDGSQINPTCFNRFSRRELIMIFDPPHGLKTKRNSSVSSFPNTGSRLFSISPALVDKQFERLLHERNVFDDYQQALSDPTICDTKTGTVAPIENNACPALVNPSAAPAPDEHGATVPTLDEPAAALTSDEPDTAFTPDEPAAAHPTTTTATTPPVTSSPDDRVRFGYQEMIDVFVRQDSHRKAGLAPKARFLTKESVFLDQWSK